MKRFKKQEERLLTEFVTDPESQKYVDGVLASEYRASEPKELIRHAARLSIVDYQMRRKALFIKLEIRARELDELVYLERFHRVLQACSNENELFIADVREVFGDKESIGLAELAAGLNQLLDRPWRDVADRRGISTYQVVQKLKLFGVRNRGNYFHREDLQPVLDGDLRKKEER